VRNRTLLGHLHRLPEGKAASGEQAASDAAKQPSSAQDTTSSDAAPAAPAALGEDASASPRKQEERDSDETTQDQEVQAIESEHAEKQEEKAKPSFNGEWKMVRYEGEWEAWMLDAGVGWILRKAAAASGYGVHTTLASIQGTQDQVRITARSIKGTTVQDVRIDGCEQDDLDFVTSKQIKVTAEWEDFGGRMSLTVRVAPSQQGPVSVPLARRYLQGDDMVVEWTNCKDALVRMIFAKQS